MIIYIPKTDIFSGIFFGSGERLMECYEIGVLVFIESFTYVGLKDVLAHFEPFGLLVNA